MASSAGDVTTVDAVEDELAFIDVLISSLDPYADGHDTQFAELEAKKTHYEHLLATLRAQTRRDMFGRSNGMGGNAEQTRDNWWQAALDGRPGSNQSTSSGGDSDIPVRSTPANSMKRSRPQSSYLDPYSQHPSKRHTPEPSNAGTPASSDASYEFPYQTPPQPSEGARQRQIAAEAAAHRQQADAALARQVSQQMQAPSYNFATTSRPSVQTTLNYNGNYQRPPPTIESITPSSTQSNANQARIYSASSHRPSIKTDPDSTAPQHQLPQRPRQQVHQVVDLTASDSEDDVLEEIAPRHVPTNYRRPIPTSYSQPVTRQLYQPATTTMQQPMTMQMPGAFPSSHANGGQYVRSHPANTGLHGRGHVGPSFLGGIASGLADSAFQLQNLVFGSSNSRPFEIDDEDDDEDDVIYGGSRQMPSYGTYTGNEDLYKSRYDAIAAHDTTKTREDIQKLLENIRPDEAMPAHLRVSTPEALSVKLHKYQELGLTWLQKCEDGSNKGGVLADDMGLGKTIQMLSLMVTRKSQDPRCKTTLIIAPVALMRQWAQEIQSKLKPGCHQLTVFTHHGTRKAKSFSDLCIYDVVLTTYGSISSELKKLEKFKLRQTVNPDAVPHPSEKCIFLDPNASWYRVILDEAQCIKNRTTQAAKGACLLRAKYRFCVTGTPMMNNVEEFYSLIHFLRIKPYSQWEKFRLDINTPLRSGSDHSKTRAMQMLQALCKAVMLRRTKKSYFEGQPILVLPERSTQMDNPVFNTDEQAFYKAVESQTQLEFNKYVKRGSVGKSYSAILVLLLRLRQACCHPHLIRDYGVSAASGLPEDEMLEFARQLAEPVVNRIKESGGNFECPVCYDVTPNPAIFIPCGHDSCAECLSRITDPVNAIQSGDEAAGIRCPNCRGQIDPKRLTDFNSFKKVHMPELIAAEEPATAVDDATTDEDDDSDTDSESETMDEEDMEDDTLGGFIVHDEKDVSDDEDDDDLRRPVKKEAIKEEEGVAGSSSVADKVGPVTDEKISKGMAGQKEKKKKKEKKKSKGKGKGKEKAKKPKSKVTLAELKKLASRNKAAKKSYLRRLRKEWVSSAKIDKTMELLHEIMQDQEGEKVLIFSQWTSLLDLLEVPIDEAGFGYRRYDGSMTAPMRGDAVDDFRDASKNVRIMLISLKAGNAGLNLTSASQVIILDPFWNPYIEEQSIDRAHRLGQTRPVKVHRLLIQETVEDRIIALQEKKRALISEALDEKQGHALARLGVEELAYLFGITSDPSQRVDYVPRQRR